MQKFVAIKASTLRKKSNSRQSRVAFAGLAEHRCTGCKENKDFFVTPRTEWGIEFWNFNSLSLNSSKTTRGTAWITWILWKVCPVSKIAKHFRQLSSRTPAKRQNVYFSHFHYHLHFGWADIFWFSSYIQRSRQRTQGISPRPNRVYTSNRRRCRIHQIQLMQREIIPRRWLCSRTWWVGCWLRHLHIHDDVIMTFNFFSFLWYIL